ncbi:MAG TPA: hypothetical protein DHV48_05240 [Prolixibacteraceae bacterium]|nr:hypothetical protein [Prolixibacteraceae bacterium]
MAERTDLEEQGIAVLVAFTNEFKQQYKLQKEYDLKYIGLEIDLSWIQDINCSALRRTIEKSPCNQRINRSGLPVQPHVLEIRPAAKLARHHQIP